MKAFIVHSPKNSSVEEVENPVAQAGQVVVQVARVGVCGTDVEFFNGDMPYLHSGHAKFPMRLGHEWCGTVISVGSESDKNWIGKRVTGDTMLGCGKCKRCLSGIQHLCEDRHEIGVRNGWSGALAEQLLVPVTALYELPDSIDDTMGALIEPGGNALRAAQAAQAAPGKTILIFGSGTIGLLAAQFAMAMGATVHMISLDTKTLALAKDLGVKEVSQEFIPSKVGFDAVIDATNSHQVPAQAVEAVEPGGRLVLIGFAGSPSLFDSRRLVLKDVTAVGILSGSPALNSVIEFYSSGKIDPRPLVAATVGLAVTADVLSDKKISGASNGPKILIDPTI
ncbi:MAG: alcohol dehydrogenase [Actinobacteria bacterium]|jgi:2-desacetyl-2-hydroxyethyl bacteriochlorophyllide A dehydrogenase|nr:alcohol dehydrogenase [Actinomycetota bacterium]